MVTFPRSGVNYFAEYFCQLTGLYLPRSHDPLDAVDKHMFSIVRNPIDTIASSSAMLLTTNNNLNFENSIKNISNYYYTFYNQIINQRSNMLVGYDNFIANPSNTVVNFIEYLGLDYKIAEYKNELKNHDDYIVTSKKTKIYNEVLEYTKKLDLSNHLKEYNIALARVAFF